MFRIIRRSPWIAVGALGAWLLDAEQGPQRRAQLTDQGKRLTNSLMGNSSSRRESFPYEDSSESMDLGPTSIGEMTETSLDTATAKQAPSEREPVGSNTRR